MCDSECVVLRNGSAIGEAEWCSKETGGRETCGIVKLVSELTGDRKALCCLSFASALVLAA